ncbi:(2Fe-2S)-binding protein [Salinithrix halophila]|uniref:(2Fe-2S)-binding protein n=1 Tax=Salinithrix halophila TaxID=1485204 RepID=A0ABV8JKE1_9BACL
MNYDSIIVCRCEEVTLGKIMETLHSHPCSSRELKLRTRAGMGFCGGRTCRTLVDALAPESTGQNTHQPPLKHQPPVRPVTFGDWGNPE